MPPKLVASSTGMKIIIFFFKLCPEITSKNFKFKFLATTSRAAEVGMLLQEAKSKDGIIFIFYYNN